MSKSKGRRHYLDDQVEIMRKIRKPMPSPGRVINPKDDKKWDWRHDLDLDEDERGNNS